MSGPTIIFGGTTPDRTVLPADVAFQLFLDGFEIASMSAQEFRMYQSARSRRTA